MTLVASIMAFLGTPIGIALLGLLILINQEFMASDKVKSNSLMQFIFGSLGQGLGYVLSLVKKDPPAAK